MSDLTTDTLRRTMKAIVEITPNAPVIEMNPSPRKRRWSATRWGGPAIALVTAAAVLAVFGLTAAGILWLRAPATDVPTGAVSASVENWVVVVFLADGEASDPAGILETLANSPGVLDATLVTKAGAYAEAMELYVDDEVMIQVLTESPDLLSASVRVLVDSRSRAEEIASSSLEIPGVLANQVFYGTLEDYRHPFDDDPEATDAITEATVPGSTTRDPFATGPTASSSTAVFLNFEPTNEQREELVASLAAATSGGGIGGAESRSAQMVRAREMLRHDPEALELLQTYPEIIEAYVFFAPRITNQQQVQAGALTSSGDYAAVYSDEGIMPIGEPDLPRDATKLRSWWRAQVRREIDLACCLATRTQIANLSDARLQIVIATSLTTVDITGLSPDDLRQYATEACEAIPETPWIGPFEPDVTAHVQLIMCRHRIPWRVQPLD